MSIPARHTAENWAARPRRLEEFIVKAVDDHGDHVSLTSTRSSGFGRSKADLGRDIQVGERLELETIQCSHITGLRDANGWLFHLTNQELADEAREFSERLRRWEVESLERNRKLYWEWEQALPDWLHARIQRFRGAGGEHFLLTGWGYELIICRLAALFDADDEAGAEALSSEVGASGNQWNCAKLLARGRSEMGDEVALLVPAGISPITGSADYS